MAYTGSEPFNPTAGGTGRNSLTLHALLVGAGTSAVNFVATTATPGQILQCTGSATDPAYSTATYPGITIANQLLYSSSTNTVSGIAAGNNGVLISSAVGAPSWLANGTTGMVLTATTGSPPSWSNAASASLPYTDKAASFNVVANNGYFVTNTATATLPASPSQGNRVEFILDAAVVLTVQANTGQIIRIGNAVSASAGTAANSGVQGDSIIFIYRSSDTAWIGLSGPEGSWSTT